LQKDSSIDEKTENNWHHLIKKAMDAGISIEQIEEFLDYSISRLNRKE
jgi:XRE family transcriptional regulator, master regulator for biofilm formation